MRILSARANTVVNTGLRTVILSHAHTSILRLLLSFYPRRLLLNLNNRLFATGPAASGRLDTLFGIFWTAHVHACLLKMEYIRLLLHVPQCTLIGFSLV